MVTASASQLEIYDPSETFQIERVHGTSIFLLCEKCTLTRNAAISSLRVLVAAALCCT